MSRTKQIDKGRQFTRAMVTATCFAAALSLSGCDFQANQQGPVAVRIHAGQLELAVCDDVRARSLDVLVASSQAADWVLVWEVAGEAEIDAGAVLTQDDF